MNLNAKSFRDIRQEFGKFGEVVRQVTGGGTNTDELVTISYNDKGAAVRALQTHFTNKDYPYLDIAKGETKTNTFVTIYPFLAIFSRFKLNFTLNCGIFRFLSAIG